MTKKDFQLIAATIAELCVIIGNKEERAYQRTSIAEQFASALATTNPLFKRELFIQAATGVVAVTARKAKQDPDRMTVPHNGARTLASDIAEDR